MPEPNAAPVQDVQRSVQEVRRRADEFAVDPARVAVLGFSAGGQVALVAATKPVSFPGADARVSARPDALLLLYPWRIVGAGGAGLRSDVTRGRIDVGRHGPRGGAQRRTDAQGAQPDADATRGH